MTNLTTAEEGAKEPGQIAYEAWISCEYYYAGIEPWHRLHGRTKTTWSAIESAVETSINSREGIEWLRTKDIDRLQAAESEAQALRERVARLEGALKPFADAAECFTGRDGNYVCSRESSSGKTYFDLYHVRDFRAARAVLKEAPHAE